MFRSISTERGILLAPIWDISVVVGCVVVSEWISPLFFGKNWLAGAIPACVALAFIILSQIIKGETLRDMGWRLDNFAKAIVILLVPMLLASMILVAIGWHCGSLRLGCIRFEPPLLWTSLGLFLWALTQQYPLQAFMNRRAQEIWGAGNRSVFIVASVFALLHLPNFWLMAATFLGGLLWSFVYQRAPNLWALALSHAAMTAVLVMTVPYNALHGLRVGYNYFS